MISLNEVSRIIRSQVGVKEAALLVTGVSCPRGARAKAFSIRIKAKWWTRAIPFYKRRTSKKLERAIGDAATLRGHPLEFNGVVWK